MARQGKMEEKRAKGVFTNKYENIMFPYPWIQVQRGLYVYIQDQ